MNTFAQEAALEWARAHTGMGAEEFGEAVATVATAVETRLSTCWTPAVVPLVLESTSAETSPAT